MPFFLWLLPLTWSAPFSWPSAIPVGPPPQKVAWTSQDALDSPSTSYYDIQGHYLYVANLAGFLTRMTPSGKVTNSRWVEGLRSPRGMRSQGTRLWVADVDSLVEIDIPTAKILRRIRVPGARQLTGVALSPAGRLETGIYVSDPVAGAITHVTFNAIGSSAPGSGNADTASPATAPSFSTLISGPEAEGPAGLLVDGPNLVVAAWGVPEADLSTRTPGRLYRIALKTGAKSLLTRSPIGNLSGVEKDAASGLYWVSDWVKGIIYLISEHGSVTPGFSGFHNPGGIGFAADRNLLLIPETGSNQLDALDTQRK